MYVVTFPLEAPRNIVVLPDELLNVVCDPDRNVFSTKFEPAKMLEVTYDPVTSAMVHVTGMDPFHGTMMVPNWANCRVPPGGKVLPAGAFDHQRSVTTP
jgi:hypothetical protein